MNTNEYIQCKRLQQNEHFILDKKATFIHRRNSVEKHSAQFDHLVIESIAYHLELHVQ